MPLTSSIPAIGVGVASCAKAGVICATAKTPIIISSVFILYDIIASTALANLDTAVHAAYGMKPEEDILAFLLKLNLELADKETKGEAVTPPGLPAFVPSPESFVSRDCVRASDDLDADGSTAQSYAAAAHHHMMGKEDAPPYRAAK